MIYSTDMIDQIKNKSFSSQSIKNAIDEEFNIFSEALDLVLKEDKAFTVLTISETSFLSDKFDISKILSSIVNWFLDGIKLMGKKFRSLLPALINKDPRIKMYKKQLLNYPGSYTYTKSTYKFADLSSDYAYTNYHELEDEFSKFMANMEAMSRTKTPLEVAAVIGNMKERINDTNLSLDLLRGKLVQSRDAISSNQYSGVLFNYFRPAKMDTISVNVSELAKEYFEGYKNKVKAVDQVQDKFEKTAKKVESDIKKVKLEDYMPKVDISIELSSSFKNLSTLECNRVKNICNIYTLYFAAKIDAIIDYYKQIRNILAYICLDM